jgi:hypothetical protein
MIGRERQRLDCLHINSPPAVAVLAAKIAARLMARCPAPASASTTHDPPSLPLRGPPGPARGSRVVR